MDDPGAAGSIINAFLSVSAQTQSAATSIIVKLVLLFVLVLINAFFAMSEIAIISLNDNVVEKMAEDGHKKSKQIMKLTKNKSNFLSTIQIGVTLAGFLTSASASQSFAQLLTSGLMKLNANMNEGVIHAVSVVVITLVMSYFSLVFGELAPKRMAMQKPEKISYLAVGPLLLVAKVTKPFVKLLAGSTNLVVKLFGFDPNADEENVTEEEIRIMVDVGEEKGVIENSQKEMINNIFEFDDIDVSDIMTHRTDMVAAEDCDSLIDIVNLSIENGCSRIPIYNEDPDNIIGIVYVKDLLKYIPSALPDDKGPRDVMRKACYVPDTKNCGELFAEMTESHTQMAIVVDEYGGTAGLVTMEDLLEAIVGNIQDEYDNEDAEIVEVSDNEFEVDGLTNIEEVNELVGDIIPEGDYDTLGGFIISELGFLPQNGEMNEVQYKNLTFTILNVDERRIGKVKVVITPFQEDEESDEGKRGRDKDKDKDEDE